MPIKDVKTRQNVNIINSTHNEEKVQKQTTIHWFTKLPRFLRNKYTHTCMHTYIHHT